MRNIQNVQDLGGLGALDLDETQSSLDAEVNNIFTERNRENSLSVKRESVMKLQKQALVYP